MKRTEKETICGQPNLKHTSTLHAPYFMYSNFGACIRLRITPAMEPALRITFGAWRKSCASWTHRTEPVSRASLIALAVCAATAGLEGVAAGRGVTQRFKALKMPRWSPPLSLWMVIGAAYYLVCFMVLIRLLTLPTSGTHTAALVLLLAVMLINAYWNFLFFRRRDLRLSFLTSAVYSVAAVCLFVLLWQIDTVAAWWLSPYVAYLVYANAFGYGVWQANRDVAPPP